MFSACQLYPENSTGLYTAYLEATQRKYGYNILDLSQDTNDRLWFRTNIFPKHSPPSITYATIEDEASDIKLSRYSITEVVRKETA